MPKQCQRGSKNKYISTSVSRCIKTKITYCLTAYTKIIIEKSVSRFPSYTKQLKSLSQMPQQKPQLFKLSADSFDKTLDVFKSYWTVQQQQKKSTKQVITFKKFNTKLTPTIAYLLLKHCSSRTTSLISRQPPQSSAIGAFFQAKCLDFLFQVIK